MSKKISELDAASTLDGNELIELVQSGGNKSISLETLFSTPLWGDRTIDLNGKKLEVLEQGYPFSFLTLNPTDDAWQANVGASTDEGGGGYAQFQGSITGSAGDLVTGLAFLGVEFTGIKSADIQVLVDNTIPLTPTSQITYTADTHTFNGIINLPTQAAPASPNDGDIWREDNTDTGLKIRINGTTKTIVVS